MSDNIGLGTVGQPLDSGLGALLSGGLQIGNTFAQAQLAKNAAKGAKKNSSTIIILAAGGGLFLLVVVGLIAFRPKR